MLVAVLVSGSTNNVPKRNLNIEHPERIGLSEFIMLSKDLIPGRSLAETASSIHG
jgi:hypothetical protein